MKKLMFAAAVMAAGAAMALESANIVGYNNVKDDGSGYFMSFGVDFKSMEEGGKFTLVDTFFAHQAEEGDQAFTWNTEYWDINQFDRLPDGDGWLFTEPSTFSQETIESIEVGKGDVIWYIPVTFEDDGIAISGEVAELGEQSVTFDLDNEEGQYLFPLVNPFPIATKWGDLNTFTIEGDQLYTWNSTYWDINQFDRLPDGEGWLYTEPSTFTQETINDEDAVVLGVGVGAYYLPAETTTWTVTLK